MCLKFPFKHRKLRAVLILVYKVLFGHAHLSVGEFLKRTTNERMKSLRRHSYQLVEPSCECIAVHAFFIIHIVKLWNELPQSTNFSTSTHLSKTIFNIEMSGEFKLNNYV